MKKLQTSLRPELFLYCCFFVFRSFLIYFWSPGTSTPTKIMPPRLFSHLQYVASEENSGLIWLVSGSAQGNTLTNCRHTLIFRFRHVPKHVVSSWATSRLHREMTTCATTFSDTTRTACACTTAGMMSQL